MNTATNLTEGTWAIKYLTDCSSPLWKDPGIGIFIKTDSHLFFNHLNTSLPTNFVYTIGFDPSVKQSYYTFFAKKGTKTIPSNYPEKISLTTDADNNVVLSFLLYR
ncbi:MAG: hypothetical protein ACHQIM_19685, partial [Sphingobacteriales bacterium]